MNGQEIIEMARQAGFSIANGIVTGGINDLKRFAKLVAASCEQKIQDLEDMITELQERQE